MYCDLARTRAEYNIMKVYSHDPKQRPPHYTDIHSLAMCVKKGDCKNVLDLGIDDARLDKYFRGETIEGDLNNGWCLVCVDGYPLGLGKAVNGSVKNHLPKGIRKVK